MSVWGEGLYSERWREGLYSECVWERDCTVSVSGEGLYSECVERGTVQYSECVGRGTVQ